MAQLRLTVRAKRDEASHAVQNSYDHSEAGDYGLATTEANKALSLLREIIDIEARSLDVQRRILETEQHIEKLQQQGVPICEESIHRIGHIDRDAKQKLDDIRQQIKMLRG